LLETTDWKNFGTASGNPKCANCMVSCGYETSAVMDGFGSLKGFLAMVRGTFSKYPDPEALKLLAEAGLQQDAAQSVATPATAAEPEGSPEHDFEETRA
jgi:hypothetical protein